MKFSKSRAPDLLIALGLMLVFLSLVVQRSPPNLLGSLRLPPKDTAHWFGWIGAMTLTITSILSIRRWSIVKAGRRVIVQCALGVASLLLVVVHVNSRFFLIRPAHLPSFFT